MYMIYYIISFLPESSTIFYYGIWLCDSVTVTCDVTHNPSLVLRIENRK